MQKLTTSEIISQYNELMASPRRSYGSNGQVTRWQAKINKLVDQLSDRADAEDPEALAWYSH